MSAAFLPVPDADYVGFPAEAEMQDYVGALLAATYPRYRWRVEAFPHPQRPFYRFWPEEIAAVKILTQLLPDGMVLAAARSALVAYCVRPWEWHSTSSLKREILKGGGEALEAFGLSRKALDVAEWLAKPRYAGLLILPAGVC
jgi:hypothetical protein